ncbi:hypothetical protein ISN76_18590 [Dyella halodurans]|uniref:DUF4239 domain-containing protein n=1 Tax=Dyella halodurans TaxID=1920171 RepID=A0ABV9C894_9GAMM|nr:hypothetical protein [Dyella halodurans]
MTQHLLIFLLIFISVFGCALLGMHMRTRLPNHHLDDESATAIKLATGLIATIVALVLGLLISSAKSSFDTVSGDLKRTAVDIVRLDRALAQYGPEVQSLREQLKRSYGIWIDILASGNSVTLETMDSPQMQNRIDDFQRRLAELAPTSANQRQLQQRALGISEELFSERWLAFMHKSGAIPMTLLIALVSWLCVIFGTYGLLAPRNGTVMFFFLLCALSASGAIFVILEMNTPLTGIVKVSVTPMRDAYSQLGQ